MKQLSFTCMIVLCLMACHKDYQINTKRVQIPLNIVNGVTPHIYITVGHKLVEVTFDTGSSGLRILKGALEGATYTSLNQRVRSGYSGGNHGLNLSGEVVEAYFGFNNQSSEHPIPLMLIDDVQYITKGVTHKWIHIGDATELPKDSSNYGGFSAIMGVGMRMDGTVIGSPIPQMPGSDQFIVHFPPAGHTQGGYIIINPSGLDIAKFKNPQFLSRGTYNLPNGVKSYKDDNLKGTLIIGSSRFSVETLLDTGNPVIWTESPAFVGTTSEPAGTQVTMAVGNEPTAAQVSFTIDSSQAKRELVQVNYNKTKTANSFGAQFFFDFDVLFDPVNGRVWIAEK